MTKIDMDKCQTCKFWRIKGENGDEKDDAYKAIGICDNKNNKVHGMSEGALKRFVVDERDAIHIENSIRYPHDFGCIFHEKMDEENLD